MNKAFCDKCGCELKHINYGCIYTEPEPIVDLKIRSKKKKLETRIMDLCRECVIDIVTTKLRALP